MKIVMMWAMGKGVPNAKRCKDAAQKKNKKTLFFTSLGWDLRDLKFQRLI